MRLGVRIGVRVRVRERVGGIRVRIVRPWIRLKVKVRVRDMVTVNEC